MASLHRIVSARIRLGEYEVRCGLCGDWWPATTEFYAQANTCHACLKERRRMLRHYEPQSIEWNHGMSYAELRAVRDRFPYHQPPADLRVAVRRAYWRERERVRRAKAAAA